MTHTKLEKFLLLFLFVFAASTSGLSSQSLTVNSPSNHSVLQSGEKIALSVTLNTGDSAFYSLDGEANATMQGNTNTLQGSLQGGVLANSAHTIVIYAYANTTANTTARLEHTFAVSDETPPQISLSPAINGTAASSLLQSYNINATSDEYANISYKLNSESYAVAATVAHSANITTTPSNGQNNLTINSTDMHGNWRAYYYFFNFTYNGSGTCTDTTQNYHDGANETGLDCGGPCLPCVAFAVNTDKESYAAGEFVYISVTARPDARHNITITGPRYYHASFAYNGSTYYLVSPSNAGSYEISVSLKYRNLSPEYVAKNFTINSTPLSVSILANATTIDKGEAVEFRSVVTGNASAISYKWDLNGDGSVDGTAPGVNYTYNSPGSYAASLNVSVVSDGSGSKAVETITVRPFYNVTINVTGTAGETIGSALVKIKGVTKPSAPIAQYELSARAYAVYINATGYRDREDLITVSGNGTFSFTLKRYDDASPVVRLIEPAHNAVLASRNITVRFSVHDETVNTCSAYVNSSGWQVKLATTVMNPSLQNEQRLNVSGLENGTYHWKVECTDEEKHTNSSEARTFTVQLPEAYANANANANTSEEEDRIQGLIDEIGSAITKLNSYGKLEQEAAETLNLKGSLEKSKTELQRILRDIRNVKWRKFNISEEEAYLEGKVSDAEAVAGNATTGVVVIKSSKFVAYHGQSDIKEAANAYFGFLGRKLPKKELESYVKENLAVQQTAIITTGYKVVEIKAFSGKAKIVTLVEKALDFSGDTTSLVLLEVVPKELAKSTAEVIFLFEYTVLEDDPVISVKLPEDKKYAYYIEKELTQQQVQKTSSVLLRKEFKTGKSKAAGITGFAVFSGGGNPASRLVAEIIIVILLGAFYIAYSKGRRESRQLRSLNSLVQQIRETLHQDYEKSKQLYSQVKEIFKLLKPEERSIIYETLFELRYEIDSQYVTVLISEANALLLQGRRDYAEKAYERLNAVYKSLPPNYRKPVYARCAELYGKVMGKQKK